MLTTVYFATNRAMTGPSGDWRSYGADIARPSEPGAITYAAAFVDNTNLTADKTGAIHEIRAALAAAKEHGARKLVEQASAMLAQSVPEAAMR